LTRVRFKRLRTLASNTLSQGLSKKDYQEMHSKRRSIRDNNVIIKTKSLKALFEAMCKVIVLNTKNEEHSSRAKIKSTKKNTQKKKEKAINIVNYNKDPLKLLEVKQDIKAKKASSVNNSLPEKLQMLFEAARHNKFNVILEKGYEYSKNEIDCKDKVNYYLTLLER